jgi:hypothetical protein
MYNREERVFFAPPRNIAFLTGFLALRSTFCGKHHIAMLSIFNVYKGKHCKNTAKKIYGNKKGFQRKP